MRTIVVFPALVVVVLFVACTREATSTPTAHTSPPAASVEPTPTPAVEKDTEPGTVWSAQNGDLSVAWTKDDIYVKRISDAKQIYSVKSAAAARARSAFPERFKNNKPQFEEMTLGYRVISFTNDLLFLMETSVVSPQTSTSERFSVVDLKRPDAAVELTRFFTKEQIATAMKANTQIAEQLSIKKISSLKYEDIVSAFNTGAVQDDGTGIGPFAGCWFAQDILRSFAIKAGEGEAIRVLLGVQCADGMRDSVVRPVELNFSDKPIEALDVATIRQVVSGIPTDGPEVTVKVK